MGGCEQPWRFRIGLHWLLLQLCIAVVDRSLSIGKHPIVATKAVRLIEAVVRLCEVSYTSLSMVFIGLKDKEKK